MNSYNIIQLGNPLLRKISEPIEDMDFGTEALKYLEITLLESLKRENGLGLAAPQLGITKRALVFGMDKHPVHTHLSAIPFTILFNPMFEPLTTEMEEGYEGCLSIGALRGKVLRYKKIGYRGYDAEGNLIEREVADLHARVLQHELDHLDGIIFLDRLTNYHSLGFQEELIQAGILAAPKTD